MFGLGDADVGGGSFGVFLLELGFLGQWCGGSHDLATNLLFVFIVNMLRRSTAMDGWSSLERDLLAISPREKQNQCVRSGAGDGECGKNAQKRSYVAEADDGCGEAIRRFGKNEGRSAVEDVEPSVWIVTDILQSLALVR